MTRLRAKGLTAIAALFSLAGCIGGGGTDTPVAKSPYWLNVSAPRAVETGGITIAGPGGFCVDPASTQGGDGVRFAMLGSCASLANSASHGRPRKSAVLTASIGPQGGISVSENAETLVGLLSGPAGRSLMATDSGGEVTVTDAMAEGGVVVVQASDPMLTSVRQLEPGYWRGFFDLDGRVVTLSVFSYPGRQALTDAAGRGLLMAFVAAMREANAA